MTRDIHGLVFSLVRHIESQQNSNGEVLEFMPQSKYRNTADCR